MHVMDQWTRPDPDGGRKRIRTDRWGGPSKRWLARWTDPSTGRERSRAWDTKDEAEAFLSRLRVELADGTWVDPRAGRATVGEYSDRWLKTKAGRAKSTVASYTGIRNSDRYRKQWDAMPLNKVTRAMVREWEARVHSEVSASRTRHHHVVLNGALQLAVDDNKLRANPAAGVELPELPQSQEPRALAAEQVAAYVAALESHSEGAACFGLALIFSGGRFGELAALDVPDLDDRTLKLGPNMATVGGRQVASETKGHRRRDAPIPIRVATRIHAFVGDRKLGPLLPAPRGGRWHHGRWTAIHKAALAAAGLPESTTTHDLRHTLVSLAIDAGADVKVIQELVGHESATLTLDTYGWLRQGKLTEVADALEAVVPPKGEPTGARLQPRKYPRRSEVKTSPEKRAQRRLKAV